MSKNKTAIQNKIISVLLILAVILFPIAIFLKGLYLNISSQPFSLDVMFSWENLKKTSEIYLLFVVILPIIIIFLRKKE